ncbi:hypothetical protein [Zoogloea sp.]|uniref:hypothetical protein n=1 Tax=Zoogloea sp. TaxID=49181 RepID=UPI001415B3B9|nr:MAG: hypothetical protein F9K15_10505 [Zoogloea sp.]
MNPHDQPPLTQEEERARERLNRAFNRHGMEVLESIRGEALIVMFEIFGLEPDQSNEPKGEAVGPSSVPGG